MLVKSFVMTFGCLIGYLLKKKKSNKHIQRYFNFKNTNSENYAMCKINYLQYLFTYGYRLVKSIYFALPS